MVWAELLAARGVRPRRASARRSWPPGSGRFPVSPEAGDSEKGIIEGRAEEAVVSPAACNGGLPHTPPQPQLEEESDGNVRSSDGQRESSAIDVMPLAFAVRQSCAANLSVENGGDGADLLPMKGKEGQGSGQLFREDDVTQDDRVTGSRAGVGESERMEDGGRKKRWLISLVNSPPKRRAVLAMRRFPPGFEKAAVTGTSIISEEGLVAEATPISFASGVASVVDPISGFGASPVFRQGASKEEVQGKTVELEGATKARNRIRESQVVNRVVPHDFAGGRHDSARPRNAVTKYSPRHGFSEKMNGKRPLHQVKHVALIQRDGQVKRKFEGTSREGTPKTPMEGIVDVKKKGKRPESVKTNETLLDNAGVSGEGTVRNKTPCTQRDVVRSNINMKQDMFARKLKPGGKSHNSLRLAKESKSENDDLDLVTNRIIVQALMAPDKLPLTQGRKSIASVSRPLTPRNKLMKKDATSRKESPPKVTPSTSTRHEAIEDKEDSFSEDDENSMALVGHELNSELYGTLPPCDSTEDHTNSRSKVRNLLKLFQRTCQNLMRVDEHVCNVGRINIEAVNAMKKYPGFTKPGPILGNVPGVEVGDEFHFRVELSIVGLHRPYQAGIDTTKVNGILIAISIVSSRGYHNELPSPNELIYTGSGGKAIGKEAAEDQKLECGNLALKNCIETKTPVRVIHGVKGQSTGEVGQSKTKQILTYTYDGLYVVVGCWQEGVKGSMVFKYKLERMPGQPELVLHIEKVTRRSKVHEDLCLPDISEGKESIPIRVVNTVDGMQPMPFKYITKVKPSNAKEPSKGCDCTTRCSDSSRCACAMKNGGEIPFNFNSAIVEEKPLIYECGPSCRCPPTCHNRVSQHGAKIPLEIFKTEKRGWGVRSLSNISSGSFICEYVGELLQEAEAEKRENDEYLFDIGRNYDDEESETMEDDVGSDDVGYTIDAAKRGNVGRFINHSCSPNLYQQNVLWDHDDKMMPHVMLFAYEDIPPLQELTYDYHYKIGKVRDNNGQEKVKLCFCGSSNCRGRLY